MAKTHSKTVHKKPKSKKSITSDPKIEALLQKYELPKTIFYHATESQILKLLKHQALHHRLLADAHSPMKQFNDNRLSHATQRRRKLNKTELQRKWTDNIGVPMSVKSTLSKSDLIEFIFRLYRDQASLAKIKNGHSQYSQQQSQHSQNLTKNTRKIKSFSDKTKHEQYRETTARTKKRRQMAYDQLRKVVFETYASGIKNKGTRVNYLVAQKPQTERTNSFTRRGLKSQNNKHQTSLFSKNLKTEVEKLCEKQDSLKKKRNQIRLVQSARKHKPQIESTFTVKKVNNGSLTTRPKTQRQKTLYQCIEESETLTIVDKILRVAHTKEGNEKYGNTVPAFRAAFVREMYQYSKKQLKKQSLKNPSKEKETGGAITGTKKLQPTKPDFKCPVGSAAIFTGKRASAFSEYGRRESNYNASKFVRRQAYDKMVKQNVKVCQTVKPQSTLNQSKSQSESEGESEISKQSTKTLVPQLNLSDVTLCE